MSDFQIMAKKKQKLIKIEYKKYFSGYVATSHRYDRDVKEQQIERTLYVNRDNIMTIELDYRDGKVSNHSDTSGIFWERLYRPFFLVTVKFIGENYEEFAVKSKREANIIVKKLS